MLWCWWGRDVAGDELEDCGQLVVDAVAAGELGARAEWNPCSW